MGFEGLREGEDFYWEEGRVVFTEAFHRRRGYCCRSGCRHCPWREDPVPVHGDRPTGERAGP
ncbi:DUF5522 domain-containing protein [Thermus thermamylovorans]|uniref:Uncharacterized protein n=1 Tax=Thermus thermamylovorans TaxID=2509362 RepID=A0A4V2IV28_9DEIN|nr:DUF5522 domain-containing protein [Thermus thermamylovorans]TBH20655.1 hypothetical protein ETP66_06200 [Thermus thermamylovorans]